MPLNCFSCFKPPVPDEDTITGLLRAAGPSNIPDTLLFGDNTGSSTSHAAPSSSTAGPSTSRAATPCAAGPSSSTAGPTMSREPDLPSFSLEKLRRATNDFTSECLGEGALGKVYKGHFDEENQDVAIKWFNLQGKEPLAKFVWEVEVLRNRYHPNLLKLFGFCDEEEDRLLVYEYMALGPLDTHLFDLPPSRQPLDWNTRIKIAIDIASGLEYLHDKMNNCVVHGDLKSSNILLGEGYHAKLSDFGLAPKVDEVRVSTRTSGSMAYMAPEFHPRGILTRRTDIYSFGIVLLELITGKVAYDATRPAGQQKLNEWVEPVFRTKDRERYREVADPLLAGQYNIVSLERALCIALWCTDLEFIKRPTIAQVMEYLIKVIPPEESSPNSASSSD